jgi:protein-S-isoprenylcysteine O-methyltransferase Ste14
MLNAVVETGLWLVFLVSVLFGTAGRLDWPAAWHFVAANAALAVVGFAVMDPELIRERAKPGGPTRRWDRWVSAVMLLFSLPAPLVLAGLDARFGWSPRFPPALEPAALGVYLLGQGVGLWAAHSNRFFAAFVRVQSERGHRVVSSGPYAWIRHPGYAGGALALVAAPLSLGSLWGLLPLPIGVGLLVLRLLWEERTLAEELDGYRAYAARVRWRLLPGIW